VGRGVRGAIVKKFRRKTGRGSERLYFKVHYPAKNKPRERGFRGVGLIEGWLQMSLRVHAGIGNNLRISEE